MSDLSKEGNETFLLERIDCLWKEGGRTDWTKGFVWITLAWDDVHLKLSSRDNHLKPIFSIQFDKEYESCNGQKIFLEIFLKYNNRVSLRFQDEVTMNMVKSSVIKSSQKREFNLVLGENIQTLARKGLITPTSAKKKPIFNLFKPNYSRTLKKVENPTRNEVADDGEGRRSKSRCLFNDDRKSNSQDDFQNILRSPSQQPRSLPLNRNLNPQAHKFNSSTSISSFLSPSKSNSPSLISPFLSPSKSSSPLISSFLSPSGSSTESTIHKAASDMPNGFPNNGTNCYVSTVMQVLFSVPQFVRMIEKEDDDSNELMSELRSLLRWRDGTMDISDHYKKLDRLKKMIGFDLEKQEDAHHFFLTLIAHSEEYNEDASESFKELLGFEILETKTCLGCLAKSVKVHTHKELILPVQQSGVDVHVQAHINNYFKTISGDFICEICSHGLKVSYMIKKPPRLLIVILSKPNEQHNFSVKLGDISVHHDYDEQKIHEQKSKISESNKAKRPRPESVDLSTTKRMKKEEELTEDIANDNVEDQEPTQLVDKQTHEVGDQELNEKENQDPSLQVHQNEEDLGLPSSSYKMIGCVSHIGQSCQSGHYIADCLQLVDRYHGRWLTFDDKHVEETTFEEVTSMRKDIASFVIYMSENEFASCKNGSIDEKD